MESRRFSIISGFLQLIYIFLPLILNNHGSDGGFVGNGVNGREALEIIIGVGGGGIINSPPATSPENPPPETICPPPPAPILLFESKRIEIVYPVIQNLKNKITHDPHGIIKTWDGPDICHKYKGFFCDIVPGYNVKALAGVDFNGFNFSGPDLILTGFIDELPDIAIFHANSNNFKGTIPKKIANLPYLHELDLSNNILCGEFPKEVLGATNLTFLDFRFNSFSGILSPQVFSLDLDVLFINNNNFIQTIPDELGSTRVLFITLANNKLIGPIPRSIGKASKYIVEILLLNNQLSGCLPYEIGLLNNATIFDASRNNLTGPIPYSFACLGEMEILNLAQNKLYGSIPDLVCKLPNLVNLSLSYNYFSSVGPECLKLIKRKVLDVGMNCIEGLPNQRPAADCGAFLAKPKCCPDEKSLSWCPCSKRILLESKSPKPPRSDRTVGRFRSYGALIPH